MVICPWNKTKKDDSFTLPAQSIETMSRQNSEEPMSSVTMSAESNVTSPPALAKKTTTTRVTATAAQLHHVARMMKKKDYNIIFKRVSIMYVREKGKAKSCMSAKRIADLIRYKCAVKL